MDRIALMGMRFYGYHGVMPEETRLGQQFRVDVELTLDLQQAALTDDLADTTDYSQVFALVRQVLEGPPLKLIEAVAGRVAQRILESFAVEEVLVRVHKPNAPVPGLFDAVTVEVRRRRQL